MKKENIFDISKIINELPPNHRKVLTKKKMQDLGKITRMSSFDIYETISSECFLPLKPISKLLTIEDEKEVF